jgi:hypothetical protein
MIKTPELLYCDGPSRLTVHQDTDGCGCYIEVLDKVGSDAILLGVYTDCLYLFSYIATDLNVDIINHRLIVDGVDII